MADKEFCWFQHENIPPNEIGMFENDLIYGCVVSVPRISANKFYLTINWYMSLLPDLFTISRYPLCTIVSNTHALKLYLHMAINRANKGNYNFI